MKSEINLKNLKIDLKKYQSKEKANILMRFFKTGVGQYGEGDIFIGVVVPDSRIIAKKYFDIPLVLMDELIQSKIHEERLVAVFILVEKFKKANDKEKKEICKFYLNHTKNINNWDLVDLSAPKILGEYLLNKNREILEKLAKSKNLWEKRIAIISTFQFIYAGEYEWTFKILKLLIKDEHDLIHKACGWMLREVGKRVSEVRLEDFIKENIKIMPRTMLRYAIERLSEAKRQYYLKLK
jgi:3-methyladenine DNA glycosylase AlkD